MFIERIIKYRINIKKRRGDGDLKCNSKSRVIEVVIIKYKCIRS